MATSRIAMQALLDRLAEQGLTDELAARHSLSATLAVLGERLVYDEARALAEVVPAELAVCIEGSEYDCDFDAEELYERVRRRERTIGSRAREDAEIVLKALGECLGRDLRTRIARGLPKHAAELVLGGPELGRPPPVHRAAPRAPRSATLASGRPGSTQPLSEAAPPSGHSGSVARSASPHDETKLSGARGLTQERLDETLAAGRPGPSRPIGD